MKYVLALIIVILAIGFAVSLRAADDTKITPESLEEMFANIKANTPWDTTKPLLWGYFFTDHDPKKFERLKEALVAQGYRYVEVLEPEATDVEKIYILHVERVEQHTPQTLHARNQEFYKLARKFGVETYDGMDVGAAAQ
ncbi:ribonuclease E inhibitor RraB [Uliginosibacterium sp. 31-16]|uniref:ribonuclease E inhibitor RraB n=1 Tax=Uliginosibacterium sp. 31-16 TaxID=3068315 RepID=UPI00274007E2|nr:ribonuclease E inhibitor RraB [Uliginosibacterium sp. 31-16]MDP5241107.1 ribonuclease E inhibitor RraB [Uliginosibacterium sp. 31-16]